MSLSRIRQQFGNLGYANPNEFIDTTHYSLPIQNAVHHLRRFDPRGASPREHSYSLDTLYAGWSSQSATGIIQGIDAWQGGKLNYHYLE